MSADPQVRVDVGQRETLVAIETDGVSLLAAVDDLASEREISAVIDDLDLELDHVRRSNGGRSA